MAKAMEDAFTEINILVMASAWVVRVVMSGKHGNRHVSARVGSERGDGW